MAEFRFATPHYDYSGLAALGQGLGDYASGLKQQRDQDALASALTKFNGSNYGDVAKSLMKTNPKMALEFIKEGLKPQGHFTADAYGRVLNTDTGEFVGGGSQGGTPVTAGSPVNPNWTPTKNTDESKAANFYKNGAAAHKELSDLGDVPNNEAGTWSSFASNLEDLPYGIGNVAHGIESPDRQRFQDASAHFINAINRRESGAQVSNREWQDAYRRFIPVYGDKPETLKAKAAARQQALDGIAGEAGPMFNPSTALRETQPDTEAPDASGTSAPTGAVEAGAGGGSAPKLPPPAARKKGQTYQTSKGPLIWTGIPGREWMVR